jgi:hypothetical protein
MIPARRPVRRRGYDVDAAFMSFYVHGWGMGVALLE